MRRMKNMLVKEFLQMFRDVRMRMIIVVLPCMQMLVFAFALTTDVTRIATAVLDGDESVRSRELVRAFTSSNHFRVTARPTSPEEMIRLFDQGRIRAGIRILPGFGQNMAAGRTGMVQVLTDGSDSNTASVVAGYARSIVERFNQRLNAANNPDSGAGTISLATRAWYNPNMESTFYFVPGLIAVMLAVSGIVLTSIAIVREKEIGTIDQIMVTPIGKLEFILGKSLPYLLVGYLLMTLMFGMAHVIFQVNIKGSIPLLYLMTGVYLAANIGIALFISTSARTQQQALLTGFFVLMPLVLLSGFMYPVRNMPEPVQYLTVINPMRWYMEILRGVVLKGVGIRELAGPIAWQWGLALCFLGLARVRFSKTLG
ncbi:ABC transporter permease [Desulfoplanes formicivorans]|uniref:ABC transporter permease n=1 Tax=Desulfoplanes formicivorans TaxID=1592317 RepID=A0A194AIB5_9BACT|nr:ABC transporter permease [Desulfoplanes formicivorans]GAU08499.1 ABC transporter permease [Desulfoplanes formicivorans]